MEEGAEDEHIDAVSITRRAQWFLMSLPMVVGYIQVPFPFLRPSPETAVLCATDRATLIIPSPYPSPFQKLVMNILNRGARQRFTYLHQTSVNKKQKIDPATAKQSEREAKVFLFSTRKLRALYRTAP